MSPGAFRTPTLGPEQAARPRERAGGSGRESGATPEAADPAGARPSAVAPSKAPWDRDPAPPPPAKRLPLGQGPTSWVRLTVAGAPGAAGGAPVPVPAPQGPAAHPSFGSTCDTGAAAGSRQSSAFCSARLDPALGLFRGKDESATRCTDGGAALEGACDPADRHPPRCREGSGGGSGTRPSPPPRNSTRTTLDGLTRDSVGPSSVWDRLKLSGSLVYGHVTTES